MNWRIFFTLLIVTFTCNALEVTDFFEYDNSNELKNGEQTKYIKLDAQIHLFSESFDHIYLNSLGVLTFGTELSSFLNVPFPLEYTSIAPFYSNVDTKNAGPDTSISFTPTNSSRSLQRATELVRRNFGDANDFRASNVFVATWKNVGSYRERNDRKNTFQAVIITGDEETYVLFLYPSNGLNWLQGDLGESGLPDVRAQAGFTSEDGRFLTLKGSGTDSAKYLNQLSNIGEPGAWLFRVGRLDYAESIGEPDLAPAIESEQSRATSCANGGRLKCHIRAVCTDTRSGFCCKCKPGHYGNGFSCIKSDVPIRVTGKVTGTINDVPINAQIQSYVVLSDGRAYTAISPLPKKFGFSTQLLYHLGSVIGWLFAKPVGEDTVPNGYHITGGKLNHTTILRFENTNEELTILQKFDGLNAWDQLAVEINVNGRVPFVNASTAVSYPDISEEYVFQSEEILQAHGNVSIRVDGEEILITSEQSIEFDKCPNSDDSIDLSPIFSKLIRTTSEYQENEEALRIGLINKINRNTPVNPCTDGTASCGPNSICIPNPNHESYSCECRNGFTLYESDSSQVCVDIDECSSQNICDQNADCLNELGGYSCRCRSGFSGNGFVCEATRYAPTEQQAESETTQASENPDELNCGQCSENAECLRGVCVCKNGWNGDGIDCLYNCPSDFVWSIDRCLPIDDDEEQEIDPFCHIQGCTCPTGYELIETEETKICRLIDQATELQPEEKLPCDVEFNCNQNANCEWIESELRSKCICQPGYEGDGLTCIEKEASCLFENICNVHAQCVYDELVGKSLCKCDKGYEGDGKLCRLAPECQQSEDCVENSICDSGVCVCKDGFERDASDFCVPSGYCGGAFCAENAICQWDPVERISYCLCPDGFVGDGVKQCKSIPPPCNVRNNCGLNAQCLPKAEQAEIFECVCNAGFYGDGLICVPEVNCYNIPSLCHANGRCVNTKAGYQCICETGYVGNGSHCEPPVHHDAEFLLLSQGVAIVKVPLNGKPGIPLSMANMAIGIDKDCSHGRVYWSDISSKHIYSSKYDGKEKKPIVTENIESPEGVAIDWISRRIYWTDSKKDTIEVAALDSPNIRATIVNTGLVNPRGIAVDPQAAKLYWADWNRDEPKIEWSNLDGSDRQILLSLPAVNLPNSLTVSPRTGELCYADAGTHKIECIEPTSRYVRTIATNTSYPFGLAVTSEKFYWTDWTTKKIESTNELGVRLPSITSFLFGNHKMYGLTAVGGECSLFFSPCTINNGDCSDGQICLVNLNVPTGRVCL